MCCGTLSMMAQNRMVFMRIISAFALLIVLFNFVLFSSVVANDERKNEEATLVYEGAQFYYKRNFEQAKSYFMRAIKQDQTADSRFSLLAYTYLGLLYNEEGAYDRAIEVLKKAIEIPPEKATPHHALGVAYFKKGSLQKAIIQFNRALKINSRKVDSHYYIGLIYAKQGKYDLAITEFQEEIGDNKKALEEINKLEPKMKHD